MFENHIHMSPRNLLQIIVSPTYATKRSWHLHKDIYITILRMISSCYRAKKRHGCHTKSLTQNRRVLFQCRYVFLCCTHSSFNFARQNYNKYLIYANILVIFLRICQKSPQMVPKSKEQHERTNCSFYKSHPRARVYIYFEKQLFLCSVRSSLRCGQVVLGRWSRDGPVFDLRSHLVTITDVTVGCLFSPITKQPRQIGRAV